MPLVALRLFPLWPSVTDPALAAAVASVTPCSSSHLTRSSAIPTAVYRPDTARCTTMHSYVGRRRENRAILPCSWSSLAVDIADQRTVVHSPVVQATTKPADSLHASLAFGASYYAITSDHSRLLQSARACWCDASIYVGRSHRPAPRTDSSDDSVAERCQSHLLQSPCIRYTRSVVNHLCHLAAQDERVRR